MYKSGFAQWNKLFCKKKCEKEIFKLFAINSNSYQFGFPTDLFQPVLDYKLTNKTHVTERRLD